MQAGFQKTDQIRRAINNEDYKRAIKLASKLEKNDLARAMMAYALERVGKRDEALDICESLRLGAAASPPVALWVTHVYLLARQHKEVAKMYQRAFEATAPGSREYFDAGVQYFEAIARTLDFAEAKTQALRLAKANTASTIPPSKVFLWAATLTFLQAPRDKKDDPALKLAEAFLAKAIASASDANAVSAVPLRQYLYFQQGKFNEDALRFGPNDSKAEQAWMRALVSRGNDEHEFKILLEYIKSGSEPADDFRAVSRAVRLAVGNSERTKDIRGALEQAILAANGEKASRGPLLGLARLELLQEALGVNGTDGGIQLVDAILRFLKIHGDLPSAAADLRNDLIVFAPQQQDHTVQQGPMKNIPGDDLPSEFLLFPLSVGLDEFAERDRWSRRWANEDIPFRCSDSARTKLVEALKADGRVSAHQILRLVGGLEYTDSQVAYYVQKMREDDKSSDEWCLLAAYALMDRATLKVDCTLAIGAIILLRERLAASPDNFYIKLALHEAAGHILGAGNLALEAWKQLRVKQVQYESLGWLGQSDLSSLGLFNEAREFAMAVCDFNSRGRGEAAECFAESMRSIETGANPIEVIRLESRLRDSFQFYHSITERCLASVIPSSTKASKDEDEAGSKPANLFARLRVEVEDTARGESHVCLSEHRLASLIRRLSSSGLSSLCLNHDLDAMTFLELPFSQSAQIELDRLQSRGGPTARIPRTCGTSKTFLKTWRERMERWIHLRALLLSSLITPSQQKLDEITSLASGLGLLKDGPSWWSCALLALQIFVKAEIDNTLAETLQQMEYGWSRVDAVCFTSDPRLFLESTSTALSHGGLVVFAVLARLNLAYKSATKSKPFPYDSAKFVATRDAATRAFKATAGALSRIDEGVAGLAIDENLLASAFGMEQAKLDDARKQVADSHRESLRRLSALATMYSSLDLNKGL